MEIEWTTKSPAAESVLELVSCQCKKNKCSAKICSSFRNKLKCSVICNYRSCDNVDNKPDNGTDYEDAGRDEPGDEDSEEDTNDL